MKTFALVTYNNKPHLIEGEKLLLPAFRKYQITPYEVPWDKTGVKWEDFDLVILRTCWNYHLHIDKFINWLNILEKKRVKLWNPVNIIRWNINKKYLLDLEKMGVPIIPTKVIPNWFRDPIKKRDKMLKRVQHDIFVNWSNKLPTITLVVKPVIGASAYQTKLILLKDLNNDNPFIRNILSKTDLMIQPFQKEIQTEGEYSFIFFNKIYSHAVLKKTKKNEFRSQIDFGGKELKISPNKNLIKQAYNIIEKIKSPLLYARVDCINIKGKLHLMELELIEPYLFFEKDNKSADKFAKAVTEISKY